MNRLSHRKRSPFRKENHVAKKGPLLLLHSGRVLWQKPSFVRSFLRFCMQLSWDSDGCGAYISNPPCPAGRGSDSSGIPVTGGDGCVWWVALWTSFEYVNLLDLYSCHVPNGEIDGNKSIFYAVKLQMHPQPPPYGMDTIITPWNWAETEQKLVEIIQVSLLENLKHLSVFPQQCCHMYTFPAPCLFRLDLGRDCRGNESICFHKYFHWVEYLIFRHVETWECDEFVNVHYAKMSGKHSLVPIRRIGYWENRLL